MDIDAISEEESDPREPLLRSVCHRNNHLSKSKGTPGRTKGNHSLPQNQRKKKSPYPALADTKLTSFMDKHNISAEKVLELVRPYYGYPGGISNESDGDTSYKSSPEIRTTTKRRGVTIPLTLLPMEGGDPAKITALIDSRAMICCINIDFTRKMKWPLKKLL